MRKYNNIKKVLINAWNITFLTSLTIFNCFGNNVKGLSIFDELSYQETVEVTLEMDMENVYGNRRSNEKNKAIFSYTDKYGNAKTWNIKVALRGRYRRTRCEAMAPLKLNFKKGDLKEAGLAKFDDMKLVSHCLADKKEAKQLLVKEYLAYKIYNKISPESFRVQFLKINYKDTQTGEVDEQWGFLIEDTAEMRARVNLEKAETLYNLEREAFNIDSYKTVAFFQYMIGNPDWSSDRVHNVKLLTRKGEYVLVPYDFDFSGIVGAPYATINSEYQLDNSRDRIYLGYEEDLENYDELIYYFSLKKEEILDEIRNSDLLTRKNRKEMVKYVKSFYDDIDNISYPTYIVNTPTPGE